MKDDRELRLHLERLEDKLDTILGLLVRLLQQTDNSGPLPALPPPEPPLWQPEDLPTAITAGSPPPAVPVSPQTGPGPAKLPPSAGPAAESYVLLVSGAEDCTYWLQEGKNRIGSGPRDAIRIAKEPALAAGHIDLILKDGALKLIARSPGVMAGPPPAQLPLAPGTVQLLLPGDRFIIGGTTFVIDRGVSFDEQSPGA